ncbi:unnamed protein product [Ilex paraguariensis]|uniref:Uncharacterized protein n=1 Tax=Ilex paraguariensis TaxID=185542 RepID=A0ABC8SUA5_9AQUA
MISKKIFALLLFEFVVLNCYTEFRSVAQLLPEEEVRALETISSKLQNRYWNVSRSSCSSGGLNGTIAGGFISNVTCDCTFSDNSVCHVTRILLKEFNLTGVLPEEFSNLSYLLELDLSRNYISGSIPATFGRLNLTTLKPHQRFDSPEIGDIATLEELILEDNQLGGTLHQNLGSLRRLRRL